MSNPRAQACRRWSPYAAAAAVACSRLPFLGPGYGIDPDAYRVISAARSIRSGVYVASRLPGYPAHECITALLLPGGPRLINGATALMSAVATLALVQIGLHMRMSTWASCMLGLAFGFTPVVYRNSVCSIDYVWAIALVLLAVERTLRSRAITAGILLGLAIGMRITSGAMLLPLLLLLRSVSRERFWRAATELVASALSVGALCFAPVFATYGPSFFDYYSIGKPATVARLVELGTTEVWGSMGLLAWLLIFAALAFHHGRVSSSLRDASTRLRLGALLLACALPIAAFLALPHEAGYLIPLVPFALLAAASSLPGYPITVAAVLLLASSFTSLEDGRLSWPGPLHFERDARREQVSAARGVIAAAAALPGKALIIAGLRFPVIEAKLKGARAGEHLFVYLIESPSELERYTADGYAIYYTDRSVERRQRERCGIALTEIGAQRLRW